VSAPAGNFIVNVSTNVNQQTFNVSSGTVSTQLSLPYITAGQCTTVNSAGKVTGTPCGSGSANIAVTTGSATGFSTVTSSPTAVINFDSTTFNISLKGAATAYILPNPSSVTLQGNNLSGTYLTNSSATATYLQLSSATATYLQQSSAAATYFPSAGLLSVAHGGTGTSSPGLIAGTGVTSITGTWPNQTINTTGISNVILLQNSLQSGATFFVSSGSVNTQLALPYLPNSVLGTNSAGVIVSTTVSGGGGPSSILLQSTLQSGATFFVSSGSVNTQFALPYLPNSVLGTNSAGVLVSTVVPSVGANGNIQYALNGSLTSSNSLNYDGSANLIFQAPGGNSALLRVAATGTGASNLQIQTNTGIPYINLYASGLSQSANIEIDHSTLILEASNFPVSINDLNDDGAGAASAVLDIRSNSRGLLPPRNSSPSGNIGSPTAGLLVYNTTSNRLDLYNGSSWVEEIGTAEGIISTSTLQAGTTFYTSSGTANNFVASTATFRTQTSLPYLPNAILGTNSSGVIVSTTGFTPQVFYQQYHTNDNVTSNSPTSTGLAQTASLQNSAYKWKITLIPNLPDNGGDQVFISIFRDSTDLANSFGYLSGGHYAFIHAASGVDEYSPTALVLDAPGDTASHTYTVKIWNADNSTAVNIAINYTTFIMEEVKQ
jgi:hypothetical protein